MQIVLKCILVRLATDYPIRVKEHSDIDFNSRNAQHVKETGHKAISMDNVEILSHLSSNFIHKRKIREALQIRQYKPSINVQGASVPLSLLKLTR